MFQYQNVLIQDDNVETSFQLIGITAYFNMLWIISFDWPFGIDIEKKMVSIKYSKTCLKRPLSKSQKNVFQDQLSLNALSFHLSPRSLFCLFLSGSLRQVLLNVFNVNWHEYTVDDVPYQQTQGLHSLSSL